MNDESKRVILDGLHKALIEATCGLYRVFTSVDREKDHEEKFLRGAEKHATDYERMVALIIQKKA